MQATSNPQVSHLPPISDDPVFGPNGRPYTAERCQSACIQFHCQNLELNTNAISRTPAGDLKKVRTCLELIREELSLLRQLEQPCKAFRCAARFPTGVCWERSRGFKYLAKLQSQEVSEEYHQQLTKDYPAEEYTRTITPRYIRTNSAGSRHRANVGLLEHYNGVSLTFKVEWGANWFRSDHLEPDGVVSVLSWLSSQPALSVEPKDDFFWRDDAGVISVDGRPHGHLCANESCHLCVQNRSGDMWVSG